MKKFKTFQLLLLFLTITFMLFAFSKVSFSQDIETPPNSIPEQIEIPGYGKALKRGQEVFDLNGRKIPPSKQGSADSFESNSVIIIPPQTKNNDHLSIQSHSGCDTHWRLYWYHRWSYTSYWFVVFADFLQIVEQNGEI